MNDESQRLCLAGDTAQAIQQGSAFRFGDVRAIVSQADPRAAAPKVARLLKNYRSHSGILTFGAVILDLLHAHFPNSADKMPADSGLAHGPKPGLWVAPSVEKLAITLARDRKLVLLVRDESRDRLKETLRRTIQGRIGELNVLSREWPDDKSRDTREQAALRTERSELEEGLALTILGIREAKGLEFEDVALVNFFGSALPEIAAGWRTALGASDKQPPFVLETEFKLYYTAVTRARGKLYITEVDALAVEAAANGGGTRGPKPFGAAEPAANSVPSHGSVVSKFRAEFVPRYVSTAEILPRAMLAEEWVVRGLKFAMAAQGDDFQETVKFLSLAIEAFQKAGNRGFEGRARALLQSYSDQRVIKALHGETRVNVGLQAASALLFRGFLEEARHILAMIQPEEEHLGELSGRIGKLTERYKKEITSFDFPQRQLALYDDRVRQGDVPSMFEMARMLEHGSPLRRKSHSDAFALLEGIAATGCLAGFFQIARVFRRGGLSLARDVRQAVRNATLATEDTTVLESRLEAVKGQQSRILSDCIRQFTIADDAAFATSLSDFMDVIQEKRACQDEDVDVEDEEPFFVEVFMGALEKQVLSDEADNAMSHNARRVLCDDFLENPGGFTLRSLNFVTRWRKSFAEFQIDDKVVLMIDLKAKEKTKSENIPKKSRGKIEFIDRKMSLCRVKFDDFAETRKVPFSALEKYNPFSSTSLPAEEIKNNEGAKERERTRKIKAKAAQKEKEESRKRREADVHFRMTEAEIDVPKSSMKKWIKEGFRAENFEPTAMASIVIDKFGHRYKIKGLTEKVVKCSVGSSELKANGELCVKLNFDRASRMKWDLTTMDQFHQEGHLLHGLPPHEFRDLSVQVTFEEKKSSIEAQRAAVREGSKIGEIQAEPKRLGHVLFPLSEYLSDELKTAEELRKDAANSKAAGEDDSEDWCDIITDGWIRSSKLGKARSELHVLKKKESEVEKRKREREEKKKEDDEKKKLVSKQKEEKKARDLEKKAEAEEERRKKKEVLDAKRKVERSHKVQELQALRSASPANLSSPESAQRLTHIAKLVAEIKQLDSQIYDDDYLLDVLANAGLEPPIMPGYLGIKAKKTEKLRGLRSRHANLVEELKKKKLEETEHSTRVRKLRTKTAALKVLFKIIIFYIIV